MKMTTVDDLVADYLGRLARASAGIPEAERTELMEQISEHISATRAEARAQGAPDGPAMVRTVLERLGSPEEVAAAAGARPDDPTGDAGATKGFTRENVAVVLLIAGWVVAGLGWLVGSVLAWTSPRWTTRDKIVATVLPAPILIALMVDHNIAGPTVPGAVLLLLVVAGLVVSVVAGIRLARRAAGRTDTTRPLASA
jgi:uncharacterized membrane protein